jgi:membrane protein implicated in regulation of membrane protease activity
MAEVITMIIIWALVVGLALFIEFMINDFTSVWFSVGGLAALVTVPMGLPWPWQILVFVVVSFLFLLSLRPLTRKFIKVKTTPTNVDACIGTTHKLLKDIDEDGRGEIKIADTFWTVKCPENLKIGSMVEITGVDGNKYIVKGVLK